MYIHKGETKMIKSDYIVTIDQRTLKDIEYVVRSISTEVGWFNFADKISVNHIHISGIIIPKQDVNGVTTEITTEGMMELTEYGDDMDRIKCWGHSHVNMPVTPSGQDDTTFDELSSEQVGHDFYIRMIANKLGELRIDLKTQFTNQPKMEIHNVKWGFDTTDQMKRLDDVLKQNVTEKKHIPYAHKPNFKPANGAKKKNPVKEELTELGWDYDIWNHIQSQTGVE